MIRILFVAIALFGFAGHIFGQDELPVKKRMAVSNELGVNFTNILNKIIKVNRDSANENPYLLMYRVGSGRKWGIRISMWKRKKRALQIRKPIEKPLWTPVSALITVCPWAGVLKAVSDWTR